MHVIKFIDIERCRLGLPLMARRDLLSRLAQQVWQLGIRVLAPGCKCLEKLEGKGLAICDSQAGFVIARGVQAAVRDLCDI